MGGRRSSALRPAAVTVVAVVLLTACTVRSAPRSADRLSGSTIEVLATWSGVEQQRFEQVLRAFEKTTGARVRYVSAEHEVPVVLDERRARGQLPDVAFLPQPGLLRQYAADGRLVPLDAATVRVVDANYPSVWRALSSYGGRLSGVWFKAANKSLVWYNVAAFEKAGVVPPADISGLREVARALARVHVPPFAVAGADAWTLTDWFENLYLRLAGLRRYDLLSVHALPWTDGSVVRTLAMMADLLAPPFVAGGLQAAVHTTFEESVDAAFTVWPRAAMVVEGDFVAGLVSSTHSELGVDADVFPFPAVDGSPPAVVGGGDVAVLLRSSPAGAAFLRYLAGPDAAAIWAADGGFISPNLNLDLAVYPDDLTRSIARSLLEAGDGFRFDLSDLQPAAFGGSDSTGMRKELQRFLVTRDPQTTAARLESAARAAFSGAGR